MEKLRTKDLKVIMEKSNATVYEFAKKTTLAHSYCINTWSGKIDVELRETTLAKLAKSYPKIMALYFDSDEMKRLKKIRIKKRRKSKRSTKIKPPMKNQTVNKLAKAINENVQTSLPFPAMPEFRVSMSSDQILSELKLAIAEFEQKRALIKNLALQLQRAN
jgi:hypothetical protein